MNGDTQTSLEGRSPDPAFALAEAICRIHFEDLSLDVVSSTKHLILDALACAVAGVKTAECQILSDLVLQWGGSCESSIIGSSQRVPAPMAALVNGTMIQALDFDDTHDPSATHVTSTVLAAALAIADAYGLPGRRLISAVVVGVELACRLGLACEEKYGWTSTAVYGAFGATAAAANALGLDAVRTRHALGIVLSQAAGTTQTVIDSPLSKHMQAGIAAKAGVLSAILAQRGMSGIENIFEGRFGFFNLYKNGRYNLGPLLGDWTNPAQIEMLSLKPYPSCRATHGPIEAALEIAPHVVGQIDRIEAVEISMSQFSCDLVGSDFNPGDNPVVAAQFSAQYTVATALAEGRLGLQHFTPEAIGNGAVRELAKLVRVTPIGSTGSVQVEVRMRNGESHRKTVTVLKGHPSRPMTPKERQDKVEECIAFAGVPYGPSRAAMLIEATNNLDRGTGVAELMHSLDITRAS